MLIGMLVVFAIFLVFVRSLDHPWDLSDFITSRYLTIKLKGLLREKKNIKMDATANFFKLSITECHQTVKNLYEQVSLVAVEAYGINNVPHVSNLNVAYESPIKSKINMPNDDPTSKFVLPKFTKWMKIVKKYIKIHKKRNN